MIKLKLNMNNLNYVSEIPKKSHLNIKVNDGLTSSERWYIRHRKQKNEETLKYYYNNKKICLQKISNYRKNHKEEYSKYMSEYFFKLRVKAFAILGNKCIKCGESDFRCLQFDHINGGGTKDYYINHNEYKFLNDIINNKRNDIQLLCANCNWKKKYENKEVSSKYIIKLRKGD